MAEEVKEVKKETEGRTDFDTADAIIESVPEPLVTDKPPVEVAKPKEKEGGDELKKREKELEDLKREVSDLREQRRRDEDNERLESVRRELYKTGHEEPKKPVDEDAPISDETFDYQKPLTSMKKFLEHEQRKAREVQDVYNKQMYLEVARNNYAVGRSQSVLAEEKNPIFDGIEQVVENSIYNAFMGGKMSADDLRDPKTWEGAALLIRYGRGELDKITAAKEKITPPKADVGELPGASKKPVKGVEDIELDEKSYEIMRKMSLTKEQALEIIREERGRKE